MREWLRRNAGLAAVITAVGLLLTIFWLGSQIKDLPGLHHHHPHATPPATPQHTHKPSPAFTPMPGETIIIQRPGDGIKVVVIPTRGSPSHTPRSSPRPTHSKQPTEPTGTPKPSVSPSGPRVCVRDLVLVGDTCIKIPPLMSLRLVANQQEGAQPVDTTTLNAPLLAALFGLLVSPIVGKVTKASAPGWFKAALAYTLTTLGAVVSSVVLLPDQTWQWYAATILTAFVAHVTGHSGIVNLNGGVGIGQSGASAGVGLTIGKQDTPAKTTTTTRRRTSRKGAKGAKDAGAISLLLVVVIVLVLCAVFGGILLSKWLWILLLGLLLLFFVERGGDGV